MSLARDAARASAALLVVAACSTQATNEAKTQDGSAGSVATGGAASGGAAGSSAGTGGSGGIAGGAAGAPSGGGSSGAGTTVTATIATNANDAMFEQDVSSGLWDEKLQISSGDWIVISDLASLKQSVGLRFALDVPKDATISQAKLKIWVVAPNGSVGFLPGDTLAVKVWKQDVPFSGAHAHSPDVHGELLPAEVTGWTLSVPDGSSSFPIESPEIKSLVQAVIGQPDWGSDGGPSSICFLVSPQSLPGRKVNVMDYPSAPASLTVTFTSP